MASPTLSKDDILRLLHALNEELDRMDVVGHVHLAGGAVMCLAFDARASTRIVDALFQPSAKVLDAAIRVAEREGVHDWWLNDAVKGYVSDHATWAPFLELDYLKVFCATPEYMLAMKCLALRVGEGYHDEDDIRYLLRNIGVRSREQAMEILGRYYEITAYPGTISSVLAEILGESDSQPE